MSGFEMNTEDACTKALQEKLLKMTERNENRKAGETKRRRERYQFGSIAEQANVFSETFKEHKKKIENELAASLDAFYAGENRAQLSIRLDDVVKIIESLKKYMTESSMFLTSFDNEQAKIDFQDIMSKFNKTKDVLLPQKKFGFGSKAKRNGDKIESFEVKETVDKVPSKIEQRFGFYDMMDVTLKMTREEVCGKDVILRNLRDCTVLLLGNPGSVYMREVHDCVVMCGPVSRSVFMEHCSDNTIYFAAQQGRLTDCHDSRLYVLVTSGATVIEHCSGLHLAPYLVQYAGLDDVDMPRSGLDREAGFWDRVDDFRHLAADVASPNWAVLPEADRQPFQEA